MSHSRYTVGRYPFLPVERHEVLTGYKQKESVPQQWEGVLDALGQKYHRSLVELLQHDLGNGGASNDPQLRIFMATDFAALSAGGNSLGYEILDDEKKGQVVDGIHQDTQKRTSTLSKKLNVTGIESRVGAIPVGQILSPDRIEQFYFSSTPQLLQALLAEDRRGQMSKRAIEKKNAFGLFRDIVDTDVIQRIHTDDLHELMHLCFSLTGTNPGTVELTLALGATSSDPSLRLPSYLLGSIALMKVLFKHRLSGAIASMPQLRVYFGTSLGYSVNSIEKEKAQQCERRMASVLLHFLQSYAPDIRPYVRVQNDEHIQHISAEVAQERFALIDERFSRTDTMRRDIEIRKRDEDAKASGEELSAADSLYDQVIHQAVRMMRKQLLMTPDSAPMDVMRYSANHPDFFGDIVAHVNGQRPPDFILSIGGKGEEYFNDCRRSIVQTLKQHHADNAYYPHAIRIVQPLGKDPPYYNHEGIDPLIGGTATMPVFQDGESSAKLKSIRNDYQSLRDFLRNHIAVSHQMSIKDVSAAMIEAELQAFSLSAAREMHLS